MMTETSIAHKCCETFALACEIGTDNEGYMPLVWVEAIDGRRRLMIGDDSLPPIVLCPWCGAPIDPVVGGNATGDAPKPFAYDAEYERDRATRWAARNTGITEPRK